MTISRQRLYAALEPFGDACTRIEAGRLILGGGGGSSGPDNYKNLEALYGEQTASARLLRNQAEANLPGMVQSYVGQTNKILSPEYANKQANMAASDMGAANAQERQATERNMASMGVNPNDPRFAGSMRSTGLSNAARMAAGKNMARNDAEGMQLAVAKDAVGTFTGQSNMAAQQMGQASSGMANLASQTQQAQIQSQQNRSQNISNATSGAMAAWSMFNKGGKVTGLKTLERHMLGGAAGTQQAHQGFLSPPTPEPPPQQMQQPQQQQGMSPMDVAKMAKQKKGEGSLLDRMATRGAENTDKFGRIASNFSEEAGRNISGRASGMRMANGPTQARAASDAYGAAAQTATDPAMAQQYSQMAAEINAGSGIGTAAPVSNATIVPAGQALAGGMSAAPGAAAAVPGASSTIAGAIGSTAPAAMTAAPGMAAAVPGASSAITGALAGAGTTAAAGTAASTAAAAGGAAASGLGAGAAALGTAMPWVGAAMAVGSLLGMFADGGKVGNAYDMKEGGKVPGKWQENVDTVPALLVEEEHVLNAEASKMVGHSALERLNKKGLAARKQGKTPNKIKAVGLGALA